MVTIIIPNYNGYAFLKDCLEALKPQMNKKVHVLVVDNGSTDESVKFLQDYEGIESLLLPENTGFCGAVNAGIKESRTKYLYRFCTNSEDDMFLCRYFCNIEHKYLPERVLSHICL